MHTDTLKRMRAFRKLSSSIKRLLWLFPHIAREHAGTFKGLFSIKPSVSFHYWGSITLCIYKKGRSQLFWGTFLVSVCA